MFDATWLRCYIHYTMFVSRSFAAQLWQVAIGLAMLVALLAVVNTLRPTIVSSAAPMQAPQVSVSTDPIAFAGLGGALNVDSDDLEFALIVIPLMAVLPCVAHDRIFAARPFLSSFVPALDTPPPKRFA